MNLPPHPPTSPQGPKAHTRHIVPTRTSPTAPGAFEALWAPPPRKPAPPPLSSPAYEAVWVRPPMNPGPNLPHRPQPPPPPPPEPKPLPAAYEAVWELLPPNSKPEPEPEPEPGPEPKPLHPIFYEAMLVPDRYCCSSAGEAVWEPSQPIPMSPPPSNPSPTSSIDMARINKMRNDVNSACPMDHLGNQFTIFKVPNHIRQLDPGAYNPVAASLGPFHASFGPFDHHQNQDPDVISVTEDHKRQCVRHLLSRHESEERAINQLLDKCFLELIEQDNEVRSCYSEKPPMGAEDMAIIMLLDGCFIIYLMLKRKESIDTREGKVFLNFQEKKKLPEFPTVAGLFTLDLVLHDLLKLENQIPFFIIQLLFDNLKTPEDGHIDLVDLALNLFKDIHPKESKPFNKKSPREYHHLLHLFYSSRTEKPQQYTSTPGCFHRAIKCIESKWKKAEAIIDCKRSKGKKEQSAPPPKWIPNATELDRAGVKFKKKKPPTGNFLNITFEWGKMKITSLLCLLKLYLMFRSGRMEIPPLQIYDYTGPLFQNLIAFEQCYYDTQMRITIYALFMDCIVDQAEDVRLLQLEGILEHKLSSDQAVAELFNKLGCHIHFTWEKNYLANQIEEVNKFYDSNWHKTLAALRRDYLGNPWATISVLAAIVLLLLTIEQATFSALSYFHSS